MKKIYNPKKMERSNVNKFCDGLDNIQNMMPVILITALAVEQIKFSQKPWIVRKYLIFKQKLSKLCKQTLNMV